jgi:hypothetical protein
VEDVHSVMGSGAGIAISQLKTCRERTASDGVVVGQLDIGRGHCVRVAIGNTGWSTKDKTGVSCVAECIYLYLIVSIALGYTHSLSAW